MRRSASKLSAHAGGAPHRDEGVHRAPAGQGRPSSRIRLSSSTASVAADVLWVGDVTMIRTDEGPLYLASVEDLFSRRLLGYAMSEHHDAALTVASLQMAVVTRGGDVDGVIFHSDRGSEYTAARYQAECRKHGVVQSMGRVGCALDNGAAESLNSTLKVEFVYRHHFRTRAEARLKIATWIADFYNVKRRHSANGGLPPVTFERQMIEKRQASTVLLRAAVA
ncbi:IS3 family transposase [Nonomuraea dietziae]|uniref:IS3 family transposase n=1 Tax=Nonomuraea dietziae TaxID=65515 RepID=UPI00342B2FD2